MSGAFMDFYYNFHKNIVKVYFNKIFLKNKKLLTLVSYSGFCRRRSNKIVLTHEAATMTPSI
jgi:hypothetical protein